MPETYAYFYIDGPDFAPESVSERLGIAPTKVWRKGDPHPKLPNHFRSGSSWLLYSPLPRNEYFLDAHLGWLLNALLPVAERLKSFPPEWSKGINCVGYYTRESPNFHLSRDLLRKLVEIDVDVDFDQYLLCDTDDPWETIVTIDPNAVQPKLGLYKGAEPGATDNPDDAQRLREDH